jgi:ribosomal-protein-alanine N-acetyltransferase
MPDWRSQGIGAALLIRVLHEGVTLGAERATLEVRRSNAVARHLYERFGFVVAGVRRGYYSSPVEDALVLWREGLRQGDRGL